MSENLEQVSTPERGANVKIALKFMRHGERDKENNLLPYGREVTRKRAQESGIKKDDFDAIKAIGSDVNPQGPLHMGRSLETADIYAKEISDDVFKTRASKILNYETYKTPFPYDHYAIYNSFLPENFDDLSPEEKSAASKKAQVGTVNHIFALNTPEATTYKKEIAGSFAYLILHYAEMAKRLKSNSSVLLPAGTHGGVMEFPLQQALAWKDKEGNPHVGFDSLEVIGGDLDPSEAYTVTIERNENGDLKPLTVVFDNPARPQGEMYFDLARLEELADFYEQLHKE